MTYYMNVVLVVFFYKTVLIVGWLLARVAKDSASRPGVQPNTLVYTL